MPYTLQHSPSVLLGPQSVTRRVQEPPEIKQDKLEALLCSTAFLVSHKRRKSEGEEPSSHQEIHTPNLQSYLLLRPFAVLHMYKHGKKIIS